MPTRTSVTFLAIASLAVALGSSTGVRAAQSGALPRLASTALPPPEPPALAELDAALAAVASASSDEREVGLRRLKEGGAALLPAMAKRLAEARKTADRDAMGRLIDEARKQAREGAKKGAAGAKKKDDDASTKKKDGASTKKKDDASAKKKDDASAKKKDDDTGSKKKPDDTAAKNETNDASAKKKLDETAAKKKSDDASAKKRADDNELDATGAGDWLAAVTADPKPRDAAYRDVTAVLATSRALSDIGSTPAVRELIATYVYFGDLFRVDVQRKLEALGDRAVPALLEAKKHDAEKVRRWAARELDRLGKAIPGEAVQIVDPQTLADVLRAFGRTKDIDALRVVVSFTASDRLQVRDAAREAVTSYGEAAIWQLREAFETFTGQRPTPGSTWEKLAADLYAAHDRARLAEVYGFFDDGLERQKAGKLTEAAELFDRVLARAPAFERRAEMVPAYASLARSAASNDSARALLLARKALRIDPEGPEAKSLTSLVLTLEGEALVTRGVADSVPFKRALEADATNARARNDLLRIESGSRAAASALYRYIAAALIGIIAIAAAFAIGMRRPRDHGEGQNA